MTDPSFTNDLFKDTFTLKQELPMNEDSNFSNISGCMPIPSRRNPDMNQIKDFNIDFGDASPLMQDHEKYTDINTNHLLWSSTINGVDVELTKMEDDIFEVDESDLIPDSQFSTLTDLNPSRDILDDLNFDDLLPSEFCVLNVPSLQRLSPSHPLATATPANSYDSSYSPFLADTATSPFYKDSLESASIPSSPLNIITSNTKTYLSLESNNSTLNSPTLLSPSSNSAGTPQKPSSLHELLLKKDPLLLSPGSSGSGSSQAAAKTLGQSVPGSSLLQTAVSRRSGVRTSPASSGLSTSAPTHLGLEQIWQRREPRPHLLSTGSLVEAGSASSLSTGESATSVFLFHLEINVLMLLSELGSLIN